MTTSPLVGRKLDTNKSSSRQGNKPERLIIHHTAGGGNSLAIQMLSGTLGPNDKKVSSHYINLTTGELVGSVDEELRAWTTGWEADKNSITVETVNTTGAPNWEVSANQLESLAQLAADCSVRYNWGPLTRENVRGHKEFAATACPGPFIWANFDNIINRANEIRLLRLGQTTTPPVADPEPTTPGTLADLSKLIDRIVRGELGNGQERISALKAMGFNDDQVAAIKLEVDRRVAELRSGSVVATPTLEPKEEPLTSAILIAINKMILSIIRGDWGNGQERIDRLKAAGYSDGQIQALQAAVTERLKG